MSLLVRTAVGAALVIFVTSAATAQAQHDQVTNPSDPRAGDFAAALDRLMTDLATQIVRDGGTNLSGS